MKEIPLTQGLVAIVDDEDYPALAAFKWQVHCGNRRSHTKYASRKVGNSRKKQISLLMHRVILNASPEEHVDHVNGNGLDNRRQNLRLATQSQNMCNRGPNHESASGIKGVHWHKPRNKWRARIKINRKEQHLGLFESKEEAAAAYAKAANALHGEFARI